MEGSAIGGLKRKLPFTKKPVPTGNLEPPLKKKFIPTSGLKPGYDQRCTRSSSTKKVRFDCPDSPESSPKTSGPALKRCSFKPIRFPLTSTEGSARKGTFNFGTNPSSSEKKKSLMQPIRLIENDVLPKTSPFVFGTVPGRSQRRCTILPVKLCILNAEDNKKHKLPNSEGQSLSDKKRRLPQPVRLIDSDKKTPKTVATQRKSMNQPIKFTLQEPDANSKPGARKCLWSDRNVGKTVISQTRVGLAPAPIKRRQTAIGLQERKVLTTAKSKNLQRRLSPIVQSNREKINVGMQTTCDMGTQTDEIAVPNESPENSSLITFETMENLAATPKQNKGSLNRVIQNINKRLDAIESVLFDKENRQMNTPVGKKDLRKAAMMNSTTKNVEQKTPLRVRDGTIQTYREVVSNFRFLETPSGLIGPNTRSTHKEHNLSRKILNQLNDL